MSRRPVTALVRAILVGAAVAAASAAAPASSPAIVLASAATYSVNTTADTPDADVGTAKCADAHGHCSLRAAVMQANFHAGADTIVVPAGTFKLTRKGDEDAAILGDLDLSDSVTIKGKGSTKTIIDANGTVTGDRAVQVLPSAKVVSISGLTLRNGRRTATFDTGGALAWAGGGGSFTMTDVIVEKSIGYYAGGVDLQLSASGESVDLNHVTIRSNTATAAAGGLSVALNANTVAFRLRNSRVYGNKAYQGGGVYLGGDTPPSTVPLDIAATEISANHATLSAGLESHVGTATVPMTIHDASIHDNIADAYGGGLGNYGYLVVNGSTIGTNAAVQRGGGEYAYAGSVTYLIDSTVSGNTAGTSGGGVYEEKFVSSAASLATQDATFGGNAATTGGAFFLEPGTSAAVTNTLIAEGASGANCSAALNASTTSFADDASCGLGAGDSASILLSALALHGGRTPTQVPLAGSAGIDAGTTLVSPATDQRGIARPQGSATDAGAVEVCGAKPAAPALAKPVNGKTTSLRHVTLDWSTVACVQGYKVVVRRGSTTGTVVESVTGLQPSALLTVLLARGHTYYWRVTAIGDRGTTTSGWRHFHVS